MNDIDLIDESTIRRMIETSYRFSRLSDGCYTVINPIGVIDSKVWYGISYQCPELCSRGMTLRDYKKYLEIREFPDPEGVPLIDDKRFYTTKWAAAVPVRSRSEKGWVNKKHHWVEILNLPKKDDSENQKNVLLRNLIVHCGCGGHPIAHILCLRNYRVLSDGRMPYTNSIVDFHGSLALHHLSLNYGFEGFGVWDFGSDSLRATNYIVNRQLRAKHRIDNDILNNTILHTTRLFGQLNERLFFKK